MAGHPYGKAFMLFMFKVYSLIKIMGSVLKKATFTCS